MIIKFYKIFDVVKILRTANVTFRQRIKKKIALKNK